MVRLLEWLLNIPVPSRAVRDPSRSGLVLLNTTEKTGRLWLCDPQVSLNLLRRLEPEWLLATSMTVAAHREVLDLSGSLLSVSSRFLQTLALLSVLAVLVLRSRLSASALAVPIGWRVLALNGTRTPMLLSVGLTHDPPVRLGLSVVPRFPIMLPPFLLDTELEQLII